MRDREAHERRITSELRSHRQIAEQSIPSGGTSGGEPGHEIGPSASAENAIQWGTLEVKIIDEYNSILKEKDRPSTYSSCANLIQRRIDYKGSSENIERRMRMLRAEGIIKDMK